MQLKTWWCIRSGSTCWDTDNGEPTGKVLSSSYEDLWFWLKYCNQYNFKLWCKRNLWYENVLGRITFGLILVRGNLGTSCHPSWKEHCQLGGCGWLSVQVHDCPACTRRAVINCYVQQEIINSKFNVAHLRIGLCNIFMVVKHVFLTSLIFYQYLCLQKKVGI